MIHDIEQISFAELQELAFQLNKKLSHNDIRTKSLTCTEKTLVSNDLSRVHNEIRRRRGMRVHGAGSNFVK